MHLLCFKFFFFLIYLVPLGLLAKNTHFRPDKHLEIKTKSISFNNFPKAFNPSLYKTPYGILLTFRYCPDPAKIWISEIGIVKLDKSMNPISEPQILNIRSTEKYPPYYDDCKIFSYNEKLYLLYSDVAEFIHTPDPNINPFLLFKEDMYIAELRCENNQFVVGTPLRLFYKDKYNYQLREKNWVPFEWNGRLFFSYFLFPHEVVEADLTTGECRYVCVTQRVHPWNYGQVRGTTPPILIKGEYLAFFHSSTKLKSNISKGNEIRHYFMGAYTFSSQPPFEITKASPSPIMAKNMYTFSDMFDHIVYPCGNIVLGENLYLSFGKKDEEIWIAKMSIKDLLDSLVRIKG